MIEGILITVWAVSGVLLALSSILGLTLKSPDGRLIHPDGHWTRIIVTVYWFLFGFFVLVLSNLPERSL